MGFNDYSKKQNDQLPVGENLVEKERKRVEEILNRKLERIKDFGYKDDLFVDYFKIDHTSRTIHIYLKYCMEFWEFIKYDNYEEVGEKTQKTIVRCQGYEREIETYVNKLLSDENLYAKSWSFDLARSDTLKYRN